MITVDDHPTVHCWSTPTHWLLALYSLFAFFFFCRLAVYASLERANVVGPSAAVLYHEDFASRQLLCQVCIAACNRFMSSYVLSVHILMLVLNGYCLTGCVYGIRKVMVNKCGKVHAACCTLAMPWVS